ncbi:hypothetical protein LguiA_009209 [Lonicera macranthoides]
MDAPHLISPLLVSSFKVDRHKALKGPVRNRNSVKSLTARSFSGLTFQLQSRNKGLANKEDKSIKRNSRKKVRKKGKLNKKISSDSGLNELKCAHVSSTSNTDAKKIRVGPLPCANTLSVSVPQHKSENGLSGEHHLCNSENGLQTNFPEFSIINLNGEIEDTNSKPVSCYEEPCSSVFSETSNSVLLDSSSLGSSSDPSFNADEESTTSDISKSHDYISRKRDSSNDVLDLDISAGKANFGKQGHLEVWEKRETPVKRVPKNSTPYRVGSASSLHGRFGKENNHSVWQKVQRNDAVECKYESSRVNSVCSPSLKKNQHFDSNMLSSSEDKTQIKLEVSRKPKKKNCPRSKEYDYYSGKGQKLLDTVSRSTSKISYPRIGFQTKKSESLMFKPVQSSQFSPNESKPLENVYTNVPSLNDHSSLNLSKMFEELSAVDEGAKVDKEVYYSKKWIPIGVKDSPLTTLSQPRGESTAEIDEPDDDSRSFQITAAEEFLSDSNVLVSSINSTVMCTEQSAQTVNGSTSEECINNHAAAKRVIPEPQNLNIYASQSDLSKIVGAVNNACRAQLASEAIQMATGYPIAEFERLLLSASPVVCLTYDIISCQTCSCDRVIGSSLCKHEMPKISLGSLWQWYEKIGTYGLEVKAEDNENSKRFGGDSVDFCAYFVPFLSAVQLFRKCKGNCEHNSDGVCNTDAMEADEMYKTSEKSSNLGDLPMFSVCIEESVSVQPVDCRWSSDLELLYEFFESEQPQKRRPLFEMIKKLVKGDGPPQCRVHGDPSILDSADLHDLHPKSWYSVAWYPIYRIPDGNFRAAFLTYHSLGHLVHKSSTFDSLCRDPCIVSPVVGLQSYNAQNECWFQPRHSAHSLTTEVLNLKPEGILKERLSTLELTASLMARAVVTKGSQTLTNRQPDYEFFVSRQR